jgi:hypothetical protein
MKLHPPASIASPHLHYTYVLPATDVLKQASSFKRPLPIEVSTKSEKAFYPDLARVVDSTARVGQNLKGILNPEILKATQQNIIDYGFSWMHLPHAKHDTTAVFEKERETFRVLANNLFDYFHINSRSKMKEKDWMNHRESKNRGNKTFHQDHANQKGFITLVYAGRKNIHGGHFEIRNEAQNTLYRIPNLDNRFTMISFRDNGNIFHRSTPRIPIERKAPDVVSPFTMDDSRTPTHTLLAFRGYQGKRDLPFHYEGDTTSPHLA